MIVGIRVYQSLRVFGLFALGLLRLDYTNFRERDVYNTLATVIVPPLLSNFGQVGG